MKVRAKESSRIVGSLAPVITPGAVREDERVMAALEEYLAALEVGQRIDRHEFLARHASIADLLAGYMESLEFVQIAAPQLHQSVDARALTDSALIDAPAVERLGDFRILRPVGRGGMGVVYEADQLSLGRRVALKVLPFAAMMDPRHLQRFHNEARAAAMLHHSNIVPVYAVGSERGVHYYAMQFIEGRTLTAVIAELQRLSRHPGPTPKIEEAATTPYVSGVGGAAIQGAETAREAAAGISTLMTPKGRAFFQSVAQRGVQVAEAIEHAHQVGIVHRDIKPGNLLLDDRGNVWITDFGLAQVQSETRLTLTGDVVGTLRYMSPEQALAKRMVIDHRTDIYSLGVTLYELLTLRPAIDGDNRAEMLKKIAFEEPIPPGRLNKAIPRELETIVVKAMAKNPDERYATAKGLADDLRCFLEDRPIQARRPSLLQRLRKWTRRHRATTRAIAACLLVTLVVLAGSIGWVASDRAARLAKIKDAVAGALKESEDWQADRRLPEALSAARRADGLLAGADVDQALRQQVKARLADLKLLGKLEKVRLEKLTALKDGHFDAEGAETLYRQTFREAGLDVETLPAGEAAEHIRRSTVAAELAEVLDEWARLRRECLATNDPSWKVMLHVAQRADPDPWRRQVRKALAEGDRKALRGVVASEEVFLLPASLLSFLEFALREDKESRGQVEAFLRESQRRHPNDFWVNEDLFWYFTVTHPSQGEEGVRFATAAVALRPQSPGAHLNLGYALEKSTGRLDDAIAEYREAIRLNEDFAEAYDNLGRALRCKGRLDEAIAKYYEVLRLNKNLAGPHNGLGNVLKDKGRLDDAIAEYREAIRIKQDFAEAHDNLGNALYDKGRVDEAIAEHREAIRIKQDFAEAHNNLGANLYGTGRRDEAIAEYRQAIRIKKDYTEAHYNLGNALHDKGRLDEAIAEYREAIRIKKDNAAAHTNLGNVLRDKSLLEEAIAEYREAIRLNKNSAIAHHNLGSALAFKGQLDEAIFQYREAIRIKKEYADAHCHLGLTLMQKGLYRQAVDEIRRGHQLGSANPRWTHPSAQWLRNAEHLADLDARLPALLEGKEEAKDAGEHLLFARFCQLPHKKRYATAARWYDEAFAAQPPLSENLDSGNRFNAACAAALAGCGQGQDADKLDAQERARLRQQALDWLRADLKAYGRLLEKSDRKAGHTVAQRMQHWLLDTDFARVRGVESLARLPEEERKHWQKLWQEVEALRQRACATAADGKL